MYINIRTDIQNEWLSTEHSIYISKKKDNCSESLSLSASLDALRMTWKGCKWTTSNTSKSTQKSCHPIWPWGRLSTRSKKINSRYHALGRHEWIQIEMYIIRTSLLWIQYNSSLITLSIHHSHEHTHISIYHT